MADKRCSRCTLLYDEDDLLLTEDTNDLVCPSCSGLLANEDLSCQYDEQG